MSRLKLVAGKGPPTKKSRQRKVSPPTDKLVRGVFENAEVFGSDVRTFTVFTSTGEWLRTVIDRADLVTPEEIETLWKFLDSVDPIEEPPALRIERGHS